MIPGTQGITSRGDGMRGMLQRSVRIGRRVLLRAAWGLNKGRRDVYEPVRLGGRTHGGERDTDARWEAISREIERYEAGSILDLGCAEGWLLRQAATKHGCFALGVEADAQRVRTAELARLHDEASGYAVLQKRLDLVELHKLPLVDVVLCLSLVHHVIRVDGLDSGHAFVRAAASRARRAFIFEMGTCEETTRTWAHLMPDMPHGQLAFLKSFLESAGLRNVRAIARTPSFAREAERILCVGEVPPPIEE